MNMKNHSDLFVQAYVIHLDILKLRVLRNVRCPCDVSVRRGDSVSGQLYGTKTSGRCRLVVDGLAGRESC